MTSSKLEAHAVAIVGYGQSVQRYHLALLEVEPRLRVDAVVTADPDRRLRAQRDLPSARVLKSVAELWDNADQFDLVVLATPVETHEELTMAALEHGLNVVVEKPFGTTATEGARMLDAARSAGRFLSVFQNRRWDEGPLTARALIHAGRLGRVLRAEYRFEMWAPGFGAQAPASDHGGLLYDIGAHTVDGALDLFGDVSSVYAEIGRHGGGADNDVFIAMTHASGVRCHQLLTVYGGLPGPSLMVTGDGGTYAKPRGGRGQPEPFEPGAPKYWDVAESPDDMGLLQIDGRDAKRVASQPCGWPAFYRGVAASLDHGDPAPVDPLDAIRTLQVLEACVKSARSGDVELVQQFA